MYVKLGQSAISTLGSFNPLISFSIIIGDFTYTAETSASNTPLISDAVWSISRVDAAGSVSRPNANGSMLSAGFIFRADDMADLSWSSELTLWLDDGSGAINSPWDDNEIWVD